MTFYRESGTNTNAQTVTEKRRLHI